MLDLVLGQMEELYRDSPQGELPEDGEDDRFMEEDEGEPNSALKARRAHERRERMGAGGPIGVGRASGARLAGGQQQRDSLV